MYILCSIVMQYKEQRARKVKEASPLPLNNTTSGDTRRHKETKSRQKEEPKHSKGVIREKETKTMH